MVAGRTIQTTAIVFLISAFIIVGQPVWFAVYRWGFILLIMATVFQIGVGNMKSSARGRDVAWAVGITIGALGLLVGLSIMLVPYLVHLGQGG